MSILVGIGITAWIIIVGVLASRLATSMSSCLPREVPDNLKSFGKDEEE